MCTCPSIEMLNAIDSRELFVSITLQQLRHIKPKLLILVTQEFYERVAKPASAATGTNSQEECQQQSPDAQPSSPIIEVSREEYQRQKSIIEYLQVCFFSCIARQSSLNNFQLECYIGYN